VDDYQEKRPVEKRNGRLAVTFWESVTARCKKCNGGAYVNGAAPHCRWRHVTNSCTKKKAATRLSAKKPLGERAPPSSSPTARARRVHVFLFAPSSPRCRPTILLALPALLTLPFAHDSQHASAAAERLSLCAARELRRARLPCQWRQAATARLAASNLTSDQVIDYPRCSSCCCTPCSDAHLRHTLPTCVARGVCACAPSIHVLPQCAHLHVQQVLGSLGRVSQKPFSSTSFWQGFPFSYSLRCPQSGPHRNTVRAAHVCGGIQCVTVISLLADGSSVPSCLHFPLEIAIVAPPAAKNRLRRWEPAARRGVNS
jgi:hypothetical protein